MKFAIYIAIISSFLFFPRIEAAPILTMFFKAYPGASAQTVELIEKLKRPPYLAQHRLEIRVPQLIISGVISSYAGFMEVSNIDGETIYPRKHTNPAFYLVITPQATPNVINANTIDHWSLDPDEPVEIYYIERKVDDETGIYFWDMKEAEANTIKNNIIPLESIIIFAQPKYIYVPIGITKTSAGENLILPDIYIKKGIDITGQSLYLLNLAHYFRPLTTIYAKKNLQYSVVPVE